MARWPLALLIPPGAQFQHGLGANTVRSPMDVGPPKVRRRTTAAVHQVQFGLTIDAFQMEALREFYQETLEESGAFEWFDFRYPFFARWGLADVREWTPRFDNSPTLTYPEQTDSGRVLEAVGEVWRSHPVNVAYHSGQLYRMVARVRSTVAPTDPARDVVYFGVEGLASDGETLINKAGANSAANQHYVAAGGIDLSTVVALNSWKEFTGYFTGLGAGPFDDASNPLNPTALYTGTRFFRPLLALNSNDGDGTMQVAELSVGVDASYRFLEPPRADHAGAGYWRVGVTLEQLP